MNNARHTSKGTYNDAKSRVRYFTTDKAGYGIAQWTDSSRKEKLWNYAKNRSSIDNITTQIDFLWYELVTYHKSLYNSLLKVDATAGGAAIAASDFCLVYERPSDAGAKAKVRAEEARKLFNHYAGISTNNRIIKGTKGNSIVNDAVSLIGKIIYNEAGFVKQCYGTKYPNIETKDTLKNATAGVYNLLEYCSENATEVTTSDYGRLELRDGDLVFGRYQLDRSLGGNQDGTRPIWVAIASAGSHSLIYANRKLGKVVEEGFSVTNNTHDIISVYRLLSSAETSGTSYSDSDTSTSNPNDTPGIDPYYYTALSSIDPYAQTMISNLSKFKPAGYDFYGYLIDMTNGGEFKFYIPEFSEQAGANWGDIEIRGRSVDVKAYNSTKSRTVTINLDLYAGEGLYAASYENGIYMPSETVTKLHKDVYFVKSLEYPDYTNVITRPPSTVHLILGSAFNITGVVSNVQVQHLKPLDEQNRAMYIKLSFTVTQTAVNPPDYKDIRSGQNHIRSSATIGTLHSKGGK